MGITYEEPEFIDHLSYAAPAPPADAIIVSDLHLGAENCQAKSITAFFQEILDGHHPTRRLIINGDVFDSIDFRRLKNPTGKSSPASATSPTKLRSSGSSATTMAPPKSSPTCWASASKNTSY